MMNKKIIFSSGGTGGHIFPAINLMKHFSENGYQVTLVTDHRGNSFIKDYDKFKSYIVPSDTPMNKNVLKKIYSFVIILFSIVKSFIILKKEKPNLIIGFGGYVSFPISFASKFFNFPLIIYEPNLVLGRTNKFLLPFIKKLIVATKEPINLPQKYKSIVYKVGPILRKEFINSSMKKRKENKNFSILILGGSQGAEIFGKIIPPAIKMIKDKGFEIEVNQQCIKSQKDYINEYYDKNNIKSNVFEFKKDILSLMISSDLAISRCGASAIGELVQTSTPFIAIPYPYSMDNHQYLNAKHYSEKECCWLIEESKLNPQILFNLIYEIIVDKKKLESININMKKNYESNVYYNIDKVVGDFLRDEN